MSNVYQCFLLESFATFLIHKINSSTKPAPHLCQAFQIQLFSLLTQLNSMLLLFFTSKEGIQRLQICHVILFASRRIIENGRRAVTRPQPTTFQWSNAGGVRRSTRRGAEVGNLGQTKANRCVTHKGENSILICK